MKDLRPSGCTIRLSLIEEPRKPFFVSFEVAPESNLFRFDTGVRWVRVLAQTASGALKIAQLHYYLVGKFFQLIPNPQV